MSEDQKIISDEDIKRVEAEVLKKQAEALKVKAEEQAREIEAKVKADMEAKMEAEKLREQLKKQQEELAKIKEDMDARMKAQEEAYKKQIEESLAVKKGLSKNESPFVNSKPENIRKLSDGTEIDVSQLNHEEIEEQSRRKFVEMHRLPSDFGTPTVKYR